MVVHNPVQTALKASLHERIIVFIIAFVGTLLFFKKTRSFFKACWAGAGIGPYKKRNQIKDVNGMA